MKNPTGPLIGNRSSSKTFVKQCLATHKWLIALLYIGLCIIPEDLNGSRSIVNTIQIGSKIDGLKSVTVCYMFVLRKTDGSH